MSAAYHLGNISDMLDPRTNEKLRKAPWLLHVTLEQ
jgi:hypothetical protein